MKKIFWLIILAAVIAGLGYAGYRYYARTKLAKQAETAGAPSRQIIAAFNCADGKSIEAAFNAQASVDLVLSDGRSLNLPRAISASGARYASADESFVFWNKGDTAFIQENGTETFKNCDVSQ